MAEGGDKVCEANSGARVRGMGWSRAALVLETGHNLEVRVCRTALTNDERSWMFGRKTTS